MNVTIIDYGAGNTESVRFALERLGSSPVLSADPEVIQKADKVIFPGVGSASHAMEVLRTKGLNILIPDLKQPVLGVCLGMQVMMEYSEEGNTACLGIFPGKVVRFSEGVKIPHMGWNRVDGQDQLVPNGFYYFVHSYVVPVMDETIAESSHGQRFSAAIRKDNFIGVQFHPEKSSSIGANLLSNFLKS